MGSAEKVGYEPPPDFEEVKSNPLIDISLSNSTELWLIQYPKIQGSLMDLDRQEVTMKLHRDGHLGSFVGSSGKSYDMVKAPALDPDVAVFLSSDSGSKIVGKISRRVSLVHYPEASELQQDDSLKMKQKAQKAAESLSNLSHHSATPSKIDGSGSSRAMSGYKSSMHNSSRAKSSVSGLASKTPKRRHVEEPKRDQSVGDSGKRSGVTDEDLPQIKRKKVKTED